MEILSEIGPSAVQAKPVSIFLDLDQKLPNLIVI